MKPIDLEAEHEGLELEEWNYHWALSDISGFVVKYGLERVLKDLEDYIVCRDQNGC